MAFMVTRVSRRRARGIVANTCLYTHSSPSPVSVRASIPMRLRFESYLDARPSCGARHIAILGAVFAAGSSDQGAAALKAFVPRLPSLSPSPPFPKGLPAVTTSRAWRRTTLMSRRNALCSAFPAVETSAFAQSLILQYRGTLTQNVYEPRSSWWVSAFPTTSPVPRPARRCGIHPCGLQRTPGNTRSWFTGPTDNIDLKLALASAAHLSLSHVDAGLLLQVDRTPRSIGYPTPTLALLTEPSQPTVIVEHTLSSSAIQPFTSPRRMLCAVCVAVDHFDSQLRARRARSAARALGPTSPTVGVCPSRLTDT